MLSVKTQAMNPQTKKQSCFILLLIALTAQIGFAQSMGKIEGRISDTSNGAIDYAKIIIASESQKYELAVNEEGKYAITLPVGDYCLMAQAKAFRPSKNILIKVTTEKITEMNLSLDVNLDEVECKLPITGTIEKQRTGQTEKPKSELAPSVKNGRRKRLKNK